MSKVIAVFLLFVSIVAVGQTGQAPQQVNPITGTSRTPMEQKGYDDAKREDELAKQKLETDTRQAAAEAEAKRRASIITLNAVDVAIREEMTAVNRKKVKHDRKLIQRANKLTLELEAIKKELEADSQVIVEIQRIAPKTQ